MNPSTRSRRTTLRLAAMVVLLAQQLVKIGVQLVFASTALNAVGAVLGLILALVIAGAVVRGYLWSIGLVVLIEIAAVAADVLPFVNFWLADLDLAAAVVVIVLLAISSIVRSNS